MKNVCAGVVLNSKSIKDYEDDSKLWEFSMVDVHGPFTCRVFNNARHPAIDDKVLVFMHPDFSAHAKEVVFDADLPMISRIGAAS